MILLRRLNGSELGINADLIERVDANPDTVITLVDGTKYVVLETAPEVLEKIVEFRARILALAHRMELGDIEASVTPLRLVAEKVEEG